MSRFGARGSITLLAAVGIVMSAGLWSPAYAAPAPASTTSSFVPFNTFLSSVKSAKYKSFAAAKSSSKAFAQMRSYVLNTYQGVKVTHSYYADDSYFDCVVTATQPAVRALGVTKLATPPTLATKAAGKSQGSAAASPLSLGKKDVYGNAISCPQGTIPMQRLSLERLTKFSSLKAFLAKKPGSVETTPITPGGPHRYAVGYQYVDNYGGNSWLNLWNPYGEFSLSQQWFVNGGQTVEGGWVHYPAKFGSNSVLFIFFTPDNYASGCYNLECNGFVQTSNAFALGGAWNNYSSWGGAQWGFSQQWKYSSGNWWLFIQGTAIGYYPGSVYRSGQLTYGNANLAEFGGETYTSGSYWPWMGSGYFPSAGYTWAAYQDTVFYIARPSYTSYWSSLSRYASNPACYDISISSTYFYYGGPGGYC
jgi:Neprosin